MLTIVSLPRLLVPVGVLVPCIFVAGIVGMPGSMTPLGYALAVAVVAALPALVLRNTPVPTTAPVRRRTAGLRP